MQAHKFIPRCRATLLFSCCSLAISAHDPTTSNNTSRVKTTEFPRFGEPPVEIQRLVWQWAVDMIEPRVVSLREREVKTYEGQYSRVRSDMEVGTAPTYEPLGFPRFMKSIILDLSQEQELFEASGYPVWESIHRRRNVSSWPKPSFRYPFEDGIEFDSTASCNSPTVQGFYHWELIRCYPPHMLGLNKGDPGRAKGPKVFLHHEKPWGLRVVGTSWVRGPRWGATPAFWIRKNLFYSKYSICL